MKAPRSKAPFVSISVADPVALSSPAGTGHTSRKAPTQPGQSYAPYFISIVLCVSWALSGLRLSGLRLCDPALDTQSLLARKHISETRAVRTQRCL